MSRTDRINEILYNEDKSFNYMQIAISMPELAQKATARFFYGAYLDDVQQGYLIVLLIGASAAAAWFNMQGAKRASGGGQLAGYFALMLLSTMSQGDGFSDALFSADQKTSESMRMLVAIPCGLYLSATAFCYLKNGGCDGNVVGNLLKGAGGLLASAGMVGAANAVFGSMIYSIGKKEDEKDARERDVFLSPKGMLARFSDSVATTPGVMLTWYLYYSQMYKKQARARSAPPAIAGGMDWGKFASFTGGSSKAAPATGNGGFF